MPVASFVYGVVLFFAMLGYPAGQRGRDQHLFTWIPVGGFRSTSGFSSTRCRSASCC